MMKKFRVPDYDINIKSHELLVINTPTFQRLFRIYQLGLAYMVYPFATYTRAAHAIETLNYAQKIIDSIEDDLLSNEVIDIIRMSALLHDIAHIPFSHTLEDENIVFCEKHDKKQRLERFLTKLKNEILTTDRKRLSLLEPDKQARETTLKLVDKAKQVLLTISYGDKEENEVSESDLLEPNYWFISDIVGNTISADLLAYIKRDVEYTGIEKRHGGYRIFDYLKIKRDEHGRNRLAIGLIKAGFRIDVFSAILDVLDVRYALMERVVFHHAKCAASAMLARVARLLKLKETEALYKIGDERFIYELIKDSETDNIKREVKDAANNLIERLNSRIFYKRIYKVTLGERIEYDKSHKDDFCSRFRNSATCTEFENEVEKQFNLPQGTVAVFCPKKKMHLKEANVMVDLGKNKVYPLNHESFKDDYPKFWDRVNQIQEKYKDLWALYVFIEPDEFGKAAPVQDYLHEELGVRNDPLLETYLQEKEQYKLSKKYATHALEVSNDIKSAALNGLLQEVAWDGKSETWDKSCEVSLNTAMTIHLKESTRKEKKEELSKSKEQETNSLFSQEKTKINKKKS